MYHRIVPLLVACLGCAVGCKSQTPPPNVVVIVIDTLRADRLGCYGNQLGLTPFLDDLAKQGVVFANAYAPSSWTSPSVASLFTSRYASQHQVTWSDSKLSEAEITLAEKLKTVPYVSGGFSANLLVSGRTGYAQGFDLLGYVSPSEQEGLKTRAPHLQREALEWLDRWSGTVPRLLYLQYMEPHSPYDPPEPFRSRFLDGVEAGLDAKAANEKLARFELGKISASEVALLESLYDGEVAAVDSELQSLFGELERRRFLENAVVVVTSDHGEEFLDHGSFAHGLSLYNEVIRIPLIIVGAGIASGRIVNENVSLVDIAPTLLDLLDLPAEPLFEGRSLVPLLTGGWYRRLRSFGRSTPAVDVISELLPKRAGGMDLRKHTSALVRESLKLLFSPHGTPELYDLAVDTGERHPNPPSLAESSTVLQAALQEGVGRLVTSESARESAPLDAATREKLRQLGYGAH
jgi:arylsulfatase A-like enzyme